MACDILLLAAGFGTRLRPLTAQVPKALLPVCGVPLLDMHLERLWRLGPETIGHVVVNGHHLADPIAEHLQRWHPREGRAPDDWISFSFEPEIRGTGGAIPQAATWLRSDPFLVMNADAYFQAPIEEALAFHRAQRYAATMVLLPSPVWPNVRVAGGRVTEIVRAGPVPGGFTFSGLHVISREMLDLLPPRGFHDIRDTYEPLIERKRLGAFVWSPQDLLFADVGSPRSYLAAQQLCPSAGTQDEVVFIDPTATIESGARISGSVVLQRAVVGAGLRVHRAIIGPDVVLRESVAGQLVTTLGSRRIEP